MMPPRSRKTTTTVINSIGRFQIINSARSLDAHLPKLCKSKSRLYLRSNVLAPPPGR